MPALTHAQQELAASAAGWLWQEIDRAPEWLRRALGRDLAQEAWLAVCRAAASHDPVLYPHIPFAAFARLGVRKHLLGLSQRTVRKGRVWWQMPMDADGERFHDPADHRAACGVHPALKAWCSEEYRQARRALTWRERVTLYLRCVEGWTLAEIGAVWGVSGERVRNLSDRAADHLAAARTREQIRGPVRVAN